MKQRQSRRWQPSSKTDLRNSRRLVAFLYLAGVVSIAGFGQVEPVRTIEAELRVFETADDQYLLRARIDLPDAAKMVEYLLRGETNRTRFEVSAPVDDPAGQSPLGPRTSGQRLATEGSAVLFRFERVSRYDPFLERFILYDYPGPSEPAVYDSSEEFLRHWESLPPWTMAREMVPDPSVSLRIRGEVEQYELDKALWILSPLLPERVLRFDYETSLAELLIRRAQP